MILQKVYAQDPTGICNPLINGLCGSDNAPAKFGTLISAIVGVFLIIATLFTLLNLLLGGFGWITSGGDKAGLDAARSRIMNAIIGLIIVASSWVIFILLMQFLGITSDGGFQIILPSLFGQ